MKIVRPLRWLYDAVVSLGRWIYEDITTIVRDDPPRPPEINDPFITWLREQRMASLRANQTKRSNLIEWELERERGRRD